MKVKLLKIQTVINPILLPLFYLCTEGKQSGKCSLLSKDLKTPVLGNFQEWFWEPFPAVFLSRSDLLVCKVILPPSICWNIEDNILSWFQLGQTIIFTGVTLVSARHASCFSSCSDEDGSSWRGSRDCLGAGCLSVMQCLPHWVRQKRVARVNDRVCIICSIRPVLASKSIQLCNLTHYTVWLFIMLKCCQAQYYSRDRMNTVINIHEFKQSLLIWLLLPLYVSTSLSVMYLSSRHPSEPA